MIPQGAYTGRVQGIFRPLNLFWRGKVFCGDQVWNRILGGLFVKGQARVNGVVLFIDYPRLHLTDTLMRRQADDDAIWDGSMALGPFVVQFTLTKEAE